MKLKIIGILGLTACSIIYSCKSDSQLLYTSQKFSVYKDMVIQDQNVSEVVSPFSMNSNYKTKENETYSNLISFKFSINEKDNDLLPGVDRTIMISNQKESPIYVFGEQQPKLQNGEKGILPVNTDFTFRLDMRPVFKQFKEQGFYQCKDGSKIAQVDFKGVFIAGGSLPLSWDFVNLYHKGLQLKDVDNDGIFEITLRLNPLIPIENKTWKLTQDISSKASYSSQQPIVDALYNMSLEEAKLAIESDSTFRTGAKWSGVWTRDISYSILLSFAYLEPEVAKISLLRKVKRDRIIQDTGSGGAWPISSDRTTWALAAWEVYKATGDKVWLKKAYTIIKNTISDDYKTIRNSQGLYSGESSFLDWREQTYPKWMSNTDIYVSQNLGTNLVHYQTHMIASKMAVLLGEPNEDYEVIAAQIKKAVNEQFWMKDKGYYAQYLYGRNYVTPSPRFEALGEALSILFDIANVEQSKAIVSKSPLTEFGVTCIYPQIPGMPPYHNNGIWPFVQSYWNLAAAKVGNEKVLNHGLASIYRASGLFLTNYENMVAENGDFKGTEINSDRMLWSLAGNLSMVYRVFMGMNFEEDKLIFSPVVPKKYGGTKSLKNFKYRKAILDITVDGYGNKIASVMIDEKKIDKAIINSDLVGNHSIRIQLTNSSFDNDSINLVENKYTLANPITVLTGNVISWGNNLKAKEYKIFKNGSYLTTVNSPHFEILDMSYAEYSVSAVDYEDMESFLSEPLVYSPEKPILIEAEESGIKSDLKFVNFSGNGFVEITKEKNTKLSYQFDAIEDGDYFVDFNYSNGSGPWNTDNKCAVRSLYLNKNYIGAVVMPQRGTNEWSDWGKTNSHKIHLKKGVNTIDLQFENWNDNMNFDVNRAMVDYIRLYKIK
jgi:glycogen debranching enzyme